MSTKAIERELLDLERAYWQALKDGDTDAVMELTDDTCLVAGAQGCSSLDRASLAKLMESAEYTLQDFELQPDARVRFLRDDVAIVAYRVHEDLIVDGEPVSLDAADASTWVRRDGRWLCALHTEALVGDPFGRDRTPGR